MKTRHAIWALLCGVALAGCEGQETSYDRVAAESCISRGFEAGTPEYEQCRDAEQNYRVMREQREQFEEQKRQQDFWNRTRRGY